MELLDGYKRPWDRVTDLVKRGILTKVKSTIYVPGPSLKMRGPEPMLLANHLASPSYISMETALAYWQMIPERVYEYRSATTGRSVAYATPVGQFTFRHFPLPYYSFGQETIELAPDQAVIIATPEKALCDKIVATSALLLRGMTQTREWLLGDMRIERDTLRSLRLEEIKQWLKDAPKRESIEWLIKTIEQL